MTNKAIQAAIVGIGQTEFSKESGRSELQLASEAVLSALKDAGLTPTDVDGMVTYTIDNNEDVNVIRNLGVDGVRFSSRVPHAGGGSSGVFAHAAAAIAGGLADVVVVWRAMNERSGFRFGQPRMEKGSTGSGTNWLEWCMPFGSLTPAAWIGPNFQRYMYEYGVTNEDFGRVSVIQREYASTNPNAWFYERPITLQDHQQSRWIVEPILRKLDCCQESDGGVAMVITSAERAKDLRQPGVAIVASSQSIPFDTEVVTNYYNQDLTEMTSAVQLGKELYRQSGLGPKDMQLAMLYDAFTPQVLQQLEAYDFCKKGEAKDFVADGHIGPGGSLPVNTNGGLIGEAYIHGLNNAAEAVRQLRGSAANQVESVDHVLVSSGMSGVILEKM